jgi:hypothetical protein
MFCEDTEECRTRVGFTYERLHDALLLWSNLSDNAPGIKYATYHLVCVMESIEEESLVWTMPQAMAYLAATALNHRVYRKKSRFYGVFEQSRDDTYMLLASSFTSERFNPSITPESLYMRLTVHLMEPHEKVYEKVLIALTAMISNSDNDTRPYTSINVVRKTILQNIGYIRASKTFTEHAIQTHAALCYALMLYH